MTNDPVNERFDLPIQISPEDIDMLGHVNNTVYVEWIQEVAIAHWTFAATKDMQDTVAWVVVRHEIDYKRSARLKDKIIARTRVGTTIKNFFERYTEILRGDDMKVLAPAHHLVSYR
ncbi:MAG: acyl-CoA thioesterase [Bacteroidota bacterium]|jgi:acyl-CoA thioester hydrolase